MRVLLFSPVVSLVGNTTYGIRAQQWIEYGVVGNFSEVEFIPLRKGKGGEGVEEGARDYPNRTGLTENSIGDADPSSTPSFFPCFLSLAFVQGGRR